MNPILLDFPAAFETERLLLRAPRPGDGAALHEAILESENSLKPWMPFVHPVASIEETEANVRRAAAKFLLREDLRLQIHDRQSGAFLGSSGLHRMDWLAGRFEIGYWLRDSATGKGIVTEAVSGIVQYADRWLSAKRIEIHCDARNLRSIEVARRCGFTLEGILRGHAIDVYGDLEDTMVFAKLKLADGTWGYPESGV